MPNRLIREGFLDSEAINRLSDSAECLYHRLLLAADDAGRMDGRPDILRARLYPLDSSRRTQDVVRLLRENEKQGLVIAYEWDGKPFLQVSRWQRPGNAQYSRFPWVDGSFRIEWVKRETRDGAKEFCASSLVNPNHIPSASHRHPIEGDFRQMSGDGDVDGDVSIPQPKASGEFAIFWEAYPKKVGKLDAEKAWKTKKPPLETCLQAIQSQKQSQQWTRDEGQFIPHPATWIRQGRWEDGELQLEEGFRRPNIG